MDAPYISRQLSQSYRQSAMSSNLFSGIMIGYWDNVMGPMITKVWIGNDKVEINEDIINYVSTHTLSGELCRQTETHSIDPKFYILADLGYIFYAAIFNGHSERGQTISSLSFIMSYEDLHRYLMLERFIEQQVKLLVLKYTVLQYKDLNVAVKSFSFHLKKFVVSVNSLNDINKIPSKICINATIFGESDIANDTRLLDSKFLMRSLTSHLQTCGCTVVTGSKVQQINMFIRTLSLFSTPAECYCSSYAVERTGSKDGDIPFTREMFIQGILKDPDIEVVKISSKEILLNTFPVTLIDIDKKTVEQTTPLNEHGSSRQKMIKVELELLLQGQHDMLHNELNLFTEDFGEISIMIHQFISELFAIPNKCSIRRNHINNFLILIRQKASSLLTYVESKSDFGKNSFNESQALQLRQDLSLTSEADFRIILAMAEKLRPQIALFLVGELSRKDKNYQKERVPVIWR